MLCGYWHQHHTPTEVCPSWSQYRQMLVQKTLQVLFPHGFQVLLPVLQSNPWRLWDMVRHYYVNMIFQHTQFVFTAILPPRSHRWLPRTNSTTTKLKLAFCWRYLCHILMARDWDRRTSSVPALPQPSRIKLQQHCVPLLWGVLLQWCPVEWRGLQPVQCVGELSMHEVCGDVACLTTFVFSYFRQQRFSVIPPPSLRLFSQTLSLRQQKSLRQFSQMQPLLIQWYNNVCIHNLFHV